MALTFPLLTADFWGQLLIEQLSFDLGEHVEMNMTGGGEMITADLAPMLWRAEVRLGDMTRDEAADVMALLNVLRPSGRAFYAHDLRRPYPLSDPTGTGLSGTTQSIYSLPADPREIRLDGFPAGYVLSRGDYLTFAYAGGRRALHQVVSATVVASGAGVTPIFEVIPPLRPGAVVGTAVAVRKAICKAVIVPGSINAGVTRATITRDVSFQIQQTLR